MSKPSIDKTYCRVILITDDNLGSISHEKLIGAGFRVDWISWGYPCETGRLHCIDRLRNGAWDVALSVYSDLILPSDIIDSIKIPINIHPALPSLRGVGHDIVPLIEGHLKVGATIHYMDKDVDSGKIIHVVEADVEPKSSYGAIRKINQMNALLALDWLIGIMLAHNSLASLSDTINHISMGCQWRWCNKYFSRKEVHELRQNFFTHSGDA